MKKKTIRLTALLAVIALTVSVIGVYLPKPEDLVMYEPGTLNYYRAEAEKLEALEVYDSADLSYEELEHRNGRLVIERCIGVVLNEEKDGRVLNSYDDLDYISYARVDDAEPGDVVLTYLVYNPHSSYLDDILVRVDYILETGHENG